MRLVSSSMMEYSVLILVFAWCVFGLIADIAGGISIENCSAETCLDIEEKAATSFKCKDINDTAWVNWSIKRQNNQSFVTLVNCTPTPSICTVFQPGLVAVQRSPGQSQLLYTQKDRTEDFNAEIQCNTVPNLGGTSLQSSCKLNVISTAILSDCVVEEDRDKGTGNGRCHFEHAFSTRRGMTCNWFQTKSSDQTQKRYDGQIQSEDYTSGEVYRRGNCTLSESVQLLDNENYTYSIEFYPGSGRQSVPIRNLGGANTPDAKGDDAKGDSLPIAAIAGGTVAAVAVAIVVVAIVVVVTRRRRRRNSADRAKTSTDNGLWQEHVSGDNLPNPGRHEMLASHNIDINVGARLEASAYGVYEIMDNPDTSSWEAAESGVDRQPSGRPPQAIGQPTEEISDGYEIPVSPQGQRGTNTTSAQNTPSATVTSSSPTGDNSHGNYASLQMSDVGLPSVYTCLADPDYYNTGAAGVTGPDAETNPEYEN